MKIYQIDAFAENVFSGNPAAVIPLQDWLPDELLQKIALENNLSETAYFVPEGDGFHIRWFTPATEVKLCGHATLASAHVLFNHLNYHKEEITFHSASGVLSVRHIDKLIILDFPASLYSQPMKIPDIEKIFGIMPAECIEGNEDLMLVFGNEQEVLNLRPDFRLMCNLKYRGIIATAPSVEYDFVSRFFAPAVGVDEDPVTGSAHTLLIPYWASRNGKNEMIAKQVSERGGVVHCRYRDNRVDIGGFAVTYLIGEIYLPGNM